MSNDKNIIGRTFGRLEVIRLAKPKNGRKRYVCVCICKNVRIVEESNLLSGNTKSCGCLRHGYKGTPTYESWRGMKKRCLDKNNASYPKYGGRGIKVCERWMNSFENFLEDMKERPKGKSLDRKDVNGDYTPENCKWSTLEEQQRNRRGFKRYLYKGENLLICELVEKYGIPRGLLCNRLKNGWSIEDAMEKPLCKGKMICYEGTVLNVTDTAKLHKIPAPTLMRRLNKGWSIEDAIQKPVKGKERYFYQGNSLSLQDMVEKYKIKKQLFLRRIKDGCPVDDAIEKPSQKVGKIKYKGLFLTVENMAKELKIGKKTLYKFLKMEKPIEESIDEFLERRKPLSTASG